MKTTHYTFLLLLSLLFASCDKEDSPLPPEKYPWYFGYFKGVVDNMEISFENSKEETFVGAVYKRFKLSDDSYQNCYAFDAPVYDNRGLGLGLYLTPLEEGEFYIIIILMIIPI